MSGVKGRSGGARPNSGGARPGAGRPRKKPTAASRAVLALPDDAQVLAALTDIALGKKDASAQQVQAAVAVLRFTRVPPAAAGKKAQRQEAAHEVVGGRFAPTAAPKLAIVR